MREESGYRHDVVSVSGARGLLQLMLPTASRVARSLDLVSVSPEQLFEPSLNIRLGSRYLGDLEKRFPGRRSAAIASYNAGPEAARDWLAVRGSLDDDEWVEAIPYDQTRSYVKRVMRSLYAYAVLY
jgi:soluble lytic murein transglycosylase